MHACIDWPFFSVIIRIIVRLNAIIALSVLHQAKGSVSKRTGTNHRKCRSTITCDGHIITYPCFLQLHRLNREIDESRRSAIVINTGDGCMRAHLIVIFSRIFIIIPAQFVIRSENKGVSTIFDREAGGICCPLILRRIVFCFVVSCCAGTSGCALLCIRTIYGNREILEILLHNTEGLLNRSLEVGSLAGNNNLGRIRSNLLIVLVAYRVILWIKCNCSSTIVIGDTGDLRLYSLRILYRSLYRPGILVVIFRMDCKVHPGRRIRQIQWSDRVSTGQTATKVTVIIQNSRYRSSASLRIVANTGNLILLLAILQRIFYSIQCDMDLIICRCYFDIRPYISIGACINRKLICTRDCFSVDREGQGRRFSRISSFSFQNNTRSACIGIIFVRRRCHFIVCSRFQDLSCRHNEVA